MLGPSVLHRATPASEQLLAEALVTASRAFRHCLRPELEQERLTSPMFWTLNQLAWDGPTSAGHIAGACGVTPASISAAVDRLERAGLIARQTAHDRRVVTLAATPKGRAVHRAIWARLARSLVRSLEDVPAHDLSVTAAVLGRLAHLPGLSPARAGGRL